jgi:hypothetical protein
MDKYTTKNEIVWNKEAINILHKRLSLGKDYIKKIIRGERTPVNADAVQKEYKLVCQNLKAIETTLKLQ